MGKHDKPPTNPPIPPSEPIYKSLKARFVGPNNEPITGRASIDGLNPQSSWVSELGVEFGGLKQAGGFNLNFWPDNKAYNYVWTPINLVPENQLIVKATKVPYFIPSGTVRVNQSSAYDDRGYYLFLGTTLFPYRWLLDNNELRCDDNLIYLAENKVDYIRYFVEVGNPNDNTDGWSDRKTDPLTFSERYINYAFDNFGIRSAICIFGGCFYSDTPQKRRDVVNRVINIVRPIQHKVTWIEIVNEFRGQLNDPDEVRELCKLVQSQLPDLLAIPSSPEGWQEDFDTIYKDNTGSLLSIHHERTDKEMHWGYVRGPWSARELVNVPSVGVNDEGQGPKSSGAQDDNPLRLAFFAATSWLTKQPFFTLHTGAGVYMGGKGGISHNREANIYDVANIDSIFDYINNVRDILHKDVTSWQKLNGNNTEHLLPADHVWADGFSDGVLRTYMAKAGGKFIMLPYGILNFSEHTAKVDMTLRYFNPANKNVAYNKTLKAGDKIKFDGSPDANAGYVVIGVF